jgi:hypothetical protein
VISIWILSWYICIKYEGGSRDVNQAGNVWRKRSRSQQSIFFLLKDLLQNVVWCVSCHLLRFNLEVTYLQSKIYFSPTDSFGGTLELQVLSRLLIVWLALWTRGELFVWSRDGIKCPKQHFVINPWERKIVWNKLLYWHWNLRIVLKHEKKLYVLDEPLRTQRDAYSKHLNDVVEVARIILASCNNDRWAAKATQNMVAFDMIEHLTTLDQEHAKHERFDASKSPFQTKLRRTSYTQNDWVCWEPRAIGFTSWAGTCYWSYLAIVAGKL